MPGVLLAEGKKHLCLKGAGLFCNEEYYFFFNASVCVYPQKDGIAEAAQSAGPKHIPK